MPLNQKTKTEVDSVWHLSRRGQSCSSRCKTENLACDSKKLWDLTLTKAKTAASELGITCVEWNSWDYQQGASQCTDPTCCGSGGSCVGHCSFSGTSVCETIGDPSHQRFCPCKPLQSCSRNPLQGTPIQSFNSASAAMTACNNMPACWGFQDRSCDGVFQEGGNDFFLCGTPDTWVPSDTSCVIAKQWGYPAAPSPAPTYYDPWGSLSEILTTTTQSLPPSPPPTHERS